MDSAPPQSQHSLEKPRRDFEILKEFAQKFVCHEEKGETEMKELANQAIQYCENLVAEMPKDSLYPCLLLEDFVDTLTSSLIIKLMPSFSDFILKLSDNLSASRGVGAIITRLGNELNRRIPKNLAADALGFLTLSYSMIFGTREKAGLNLRGDINTGISTVDLGASSKDDTLCNFIRNTCCLLREANTLELKSFGPGFAQALNGVLDGIFAAMGNSKSSSSSLLLEDVYRTITSPSLFSAMATHDYYAISILLIIYSAIFLLVSDPKERPVGNLSLWGSIDGASAPELRHQMARIRDFCISSMNRCCFCPANLPWLMTSERCWVKWKSHGCHFRDMKPDAGRPGSYPRMEVFKIEAPVIEAVRIAKRRKATEFVNFTGEISTFQNLRRKVNYIE